MKIKIISFFMIVTIFYYLFFYLYVKPVEKKIETHSVITVAQSVPVKESNLMANVFTDTATTYKEFVGVIGKTPVKMHLLRSRLFEWSYTGSFYALGGNNLEFLMGHTSFIIKDNEYYAPTNMSQEIDYRTDKASKFKDEVIWLRTRSNDIFIELEGKINNKGMFYGTVKRDREITDSFFLQEVKPLISHKTISCPKNNFSLDGILPCSYKNKDFEASDVCRNIKESILSDIFFSSLNDKLFEGIYATREPIKKNGRGVCSYSVCYNEKNKLTLFIYTYYVNSNHDGGYVLKTINYDLENRRTVELNDIFIIGFEQKLKKIIDSKIKDNRMFRIENFILTEQGISFILDNIESIDYARVVFVPFEHLKEILRK
jgi:hypothetical protein